MKKYIFGVSILIFCLLLAAGCENTSDSSGKTGKLNILLTDAPADYGSVNIIFSEISAHIDSEWVHVLQEPTDVNLLEYNNGKTFLLSSENVPAGHYTQIRLKIDSAYVYDDGVPHDLSVPGGSKTGLKFGPQFTINEGSSYILVIDFDALQSVRENGKGYFLQPHIRVIAQASSGSISGTVLNPADVPFAKAIMGLDTARTLVDTVSGHFMLAFLPEGMYEIAIEDTNGLSYSNSPVMVTPGQDFDLGDITLQ